MNRLYKILFVFAMTLISYGAIAQTPQVVKLNSVRNYSVTNVDPNNYSWNVQISTDNGVNWNDAVAGTDFNFVTDAGGGTTKPLADVTDKKALVSVFIKWIKESPVNTLYRVAITEYNHTDLGVTGRCDNTKYLEVKVESNNVTVEISSTETGCSTMAADSKVRFSVQLNNGGETKNNFKEWTFVYQVWYNGVQKGADITQTASTFTDNTTNFVFDLDVDDIVDTDRVGQGTYNVKVVLVSAMDVFKTPAAIVSLKGEKEVTFNQLPKIEGGIVTD